VDRFEIQEALDFYTSNAKLSSLTYGDNPLIGLEVCASINPVPEIIKKIRRAVIEKDLFQDWFSCKEVSDFVICINEGHHLPEHADLLKDIKADTYRHVRANWIISAPEEGGHIVTEEGVYLPKVNEIHFINAKKNHSVTTVVGKTPLIIYSFGFIKKESNV
jgi:hypothetical protein